METGVAMIPDIDIRHCANVTIKRYGRRCRARSGATCRLNAWEGRHGWLPSVAEDRQNDRGNGVDGQDGGRTVELARGPGLAAVVRPQAPVVTDSGAFLAIGGAI